jgi:exportin-7
MATLGRLLASLHANPNTQAMEQHLRARPELLPAVLTSLFELVLFEDVGNQWSLSRPMLALILVNEDIYLELQRQIIAAQPADRCTA